MIKPAVKTDIKKTCNAKTEVYSRVVGFCRPVDDWNVAKQEEFKERQTYVVEKCKLSQSKK